MALLFCDSFDHYATADLASKYDLANALIAAASGRTAGALDLSASTSNYVKKDVTNSSTLIAGMAFKTSAISGSEQSLIYFQDSSSTQIELRITATSGEWRVVRGDGTVLGTSTATITASTWVYVEFKVVFHASAGTYDVRVNGASVLSGSGANTINTANAYANRVWIAGTTSGDQYHDDLYICDGTGTVNNNFLGDVTVKAILPDSAGNYSDFTPSAGSNYQNVDDATPDGDSTFNEAAETGDKDSYNFGAVGIDNPVLAVQTVLTARKDIGGTKIVRDLIRISGADYNGSNVSLTDSYQMHRTIHELNPATSAAWTVAQIDAAEFGVELVN